MIIVMELPPAYCLIIPEPVRDRLGLRGGDWIAFEEKDGKIFFKKVTPDVLNTNVFHEDHPNLSVASDWLGIYEKD